MAVALARERKRGAEAARRELRSVVAATVDKLTSECPREISAPLARLTRAAATRNFRGITPRPFAAFTASYAF